MNSKERVLATINHVEPDRLPVDMWALPPITLNLRTHFGVNTDEDVLQTLGVDLRSVWPAYIGPPLETFDDGSHLDWWGVRKKKIGPFEDAIIAPLAEAQTPADIEAYIWPDPDWFDYEGMHSVCKALSSDYALVVRDPGPHATCVLRESMFLRGMEQFILDLAMNPDLASNIIAGVEKFYLEFNQRILETVGKFIDIYFIADDIGTQKGLLISPRMFHKFIAPSLRHFIVQAKEYNQLVMYHTCGAVRRLIPDFIKIGVDILNPIQTSAEDMDPVALKRDFGGAVCFHGAFDIIIILSKGTPDEVRREVERLFRILGPGGGFILAPTNNITPETPVENIVALYETAKTVGRYHY